MDPLQLKKKQKEHIQDSQMLAIEWKNRPEGHTRGF